MDYILFRKLNIIIKKRFILFLDQKETSMKLNKTLVAATLAAAVVAPAAQADVTLSGSFGGFVVAPIDSDVDGDDVLIGSSKARINVKGSEAITDSTAAFAELELDYDDSANAGGKGTIEVRTAKVGVAGNFGTLLIAGRTASGTWNDVVGPMDIFEYGGASFFEQGSRSSNVLAYVTPSFAGGLSFVGAVVASGTNNDEDADALVARARYNNDMVHVAVSMTDYPSDEQRIGAAASANIGPATLGLAYETTTDDPTFGDKDVAGVTLASGLGNGFSVALGFNTVLEGAQEDATAIQVLVSKSLSDNVSVWAEYDNYNDEAVELDENIDSDIFAVGMSLGF
ncbi:porin [Granulosicoccaceae sp. 1_MG-2023]|nr:porin [Granulosicoccaceae sp. 1_MG-2023]